MVRVEYAILVTVVCVIVPFVSFAEDERPDELWRCSLIDDSLARLDCYDTLSGRTSPTASESAGSLRDTSTTVNQKIPDQNVVATTVDEQEAVGKHMLDEKVADAKTLDDLGSETLPMSARKEVEKLEVRAKVSRCKKDYRKKYLFYFDNDQIWKQTSDKKLYFKDCNFDVTITQDFFGYKMQADGEKRRIRITRVK